jgi:hypothetical protein
MKGLSTWGLSAQQQQVDTIIEDYKDIFFSPTSVLVHCQIKHSIDFTPSAPLPNGPIYRSFVMDNEEIKCRIQGPHQTKLLTLWEPNCSSTEEGRDMETLY